MLKKIGMDKLHVYIQATNLFTITKYTGLDPEIVSSIDNGGGGAPLGIDYGAYPSNQKQYILGVNLSF
jgi:TonB-dependent starch-binding outer membrane protein SusC